MTTINRQSITLYAPFSCSAEAPFSCSFREGAGSWVNLSLTGNFLLAFTATIEGVHYDSFVQEFTNKLMSLSPNLWGYYPSFDVAKGEFKVEADDIWSINFHNSASAMLCGQDKPKTAIGGIDVIITGTVPPSYFWKSTYRERSKWIRPYEPEPRYSDFEADDGTTYSIGRRNGSVFSEWRFEFEPIGKIRTDNRSTTEPFTMQDFVEAVRSDKPFLLLTATSYVMAYAESVSIFEGVYKLRAEGSNFKPEYINPTYHVYMHYPFRVRVLSGTFQ